ncbi:MAG: phospholipid carrier-dependent glycosyltransferase [Clostridiales bacterium]|nr:phospholipid carrier-dependent glycosyltransferase [Clostridiales bacterium]
MEVGFESDSGELIPASCPDAPELLDEQEYIPVGLPDREPVSSYWTGTYFDEIYHARTAYEFVQGLPVYETTHPPLGKVFIAAGVEIFGMTPFGWRFAGTLFGVLMIPLMFLFARRIFGDAFWAFAVSLLFAFDFMHFAQTRIATIDTFITFFVIAMYYYMYKYYRMSWNDTPLAKTLAPLGMSGLMMGLGVASKWPGVYAGAGLAALFFLTVWKRFKEYRLAGAVLSREPSDSSLSDSEPEERETARAVRAKFWKYTAITLAACVGFFAVVPAVVYVLSYIPYYLTGSLFGGDADKWISQGLLPGGDAGKLIGGVIRAQSFMFDYHYNLVSDHPYASQWWSWPIILKPIFFYSHYYTDSVSGGISSFGNPVVWLGGLAALIFGARETYHGRDTGIWKFVLIAWLAQYVFWIPVPRTTYIYHYFPCVPFLAVALGLALKRACERFGSKRPAYIVMGAALLLFALYYPVLSGIPVAKWYVNWVLKLAAPNWQLII